MESDLEKLIASKLRSFLRKQWRFYSLARKEVKLNCTVYYQKYKRNGEPYKLQTIKGYKCYHCNRTTKKIDIHHTHPVGHLNLRDVYAYLDRLFCSKDKLIPLCKECHLKEHKKLRKEAKLAKERNDGKTIIKEADNS